jgi:murein DD-endopeptidase MepM/ murein hydrolase activator NlpD
MLRPLLLVLGLFAIVLLVGLLAIVGFGDDPDADEPTARRVSQPIQLALPIDCDLPDRCVVQFHVDRRPGLAVGDWRCGQLSYDTHRGTDFRVLAKDDFVAGIPVLAAAPGKVIALRDGMEDIDVVELGRTKVEGRAGGNQVVIAHEDGWETWYWHLRKDSVAVQQGQTVATGARLGTVGLSGDTNFPHLHFELRRNRNLIVDPFDASAGDDQCRSPPQSLWTKSAAAALNYIPVVARLGFTTRAATRNEAIYGRLPDPAAQENVPALFLWFELYGLARNDEISVQWQLPGGTWREPAQSAWQQDLPYAFQTGRLNLQPPLPRGTYSVRLKVSRDGNAPPLLEKIYSVTLR